MITEWNLQPLDKMWLQGLLPTVITYKTLICACGKGTMTECALQLVDEMRQQGLQPNVVTYDTLVSACVKGNMA